jgi:hypothetical protein
VLLLPWPTTTTRSSTRSHDTQPFVEPFAACSASTGDIDLDGLRVRHGALVALIGWTLIETLILAPAGDRDRATVA